jgi:hypothetical protein
MKGGKYTDAAGTPSNDKYGLWNCLRGLKELDNGKMIVEPELGRLLLDLATDYIAEIIKKET